MLSQARKELLRSNKNKIAAYHVKSGDFNTIVCVYRYNDDDSIVCAGGACFTKQERDIIVNCDRNGKYLKNLNSDDPITMPCNLDLLDSDVIIMQKLQNSHDEYISNQSDYNFKLFDDYLNKILES